MEKKYRGPQCGSGASPGVGRRLGLTPTPAECGQGCFSGLVFLLPGLGRRVHLGHRRNTTDEFRQAKRASGGLDMRHNILRCMAI